ncbi:hypothetical protein ACIP5N_33290 [Streptomyces sp. NPDC088768]|uniref:hypothetical protein n=1 Tax=Streptomyces sp. NPDC088768 TaxID=3365894 RepID=UPI003819F54B
MGTRKVESTGHRWRGAVRWRRDASQRALVKECERLLADLPIPTPFSVEALVRNMEIALKRQIRLVPFDDPDGGLGTACGLRVKAPRFTIVLYRRRSSRNQTEHIILHELVHEWLDHGSTLTDDEMKRYVPARIREEVLQRIPGALVQGRVNYDSLEEKRTELSASLIKRLARRHPFHGDDMVSLLESSLSHPVAPPRRGRAKQN